MNQTQQMNFENEEDFVNAATKIYKTMVQDRSWVVPEPAAFGSLIQFEGADLQITDNIGNIEKRKDFGKSLNTSVIGCQQLNSFNQNLNYQQVMDEAQLKYLKEHEMKKQQLNQQDQQQLEQAKKQQKAVQNSNQNLSVNKPVDLNSTNLQSHTQMEIDYNQQSKVPKKKQNTDNNVIDQPHAIIPMQSSLVDMNEIVELKKKNLDLQKQIDEMKLEYQQQITSIKTFYSDELIQCKNELETNKQYQLKLKGEYDQYKAEIEQLQTIKDEKLNSNKIVDLQQQKRPSDQNSDLNIIIATQLQMECEQLKLQLNDEKQFHDSQQELTQQQLNLITQRNIELQKQLSEEKTQKLLFFKQLQLQQSEITKQLELIKEQALYQEQAARIMHLENENRSLQEQIEKQNISEYKNSIARLEKQIQNNEMQIETLKQELMLINAQLLKNRQDDYKIYQYDDI
ncbi:Hypothetical_protein [Hexamita inflata]|uniref:Hypothetical_protein n=1 Tax=Hexamita inflata TaxID=28002 RepID=A0AA86QWV5_9EUKA|nr:Hypothetical protein HINF_LOCUS55174 [Hexamita inflata]